MKSVDRHICLVLTSPLVLNAFLLDQIRGWCDHFKVTVCLNTRDTPVSTSLDPRVEVLNVAIERNVRVVSDLKALFWLTRLMMQRRFDAVHTLTPKGGLLGILAALFAGIRLRTHVFTGQVWATRSGFSRLYLRLLDQLVASCATDVFADSRSQARFLEQAGVCAPGRIQVLGAGSLSGVNLERFSPEVERRNAVRAELVIPGSEVVFLFLGRFQKDKGLHVLTDAFRSLVAAGAKAHLLCVGPDEGHLAPEILQAVPGRTHVVGLTACPERYIDAADVLVLPSFREGFGTVVIEAAAMARPAIASRIYGLTDAVLDGETGLLVPPGDAPALADAMKTMLDPAVRQAMAEQAQIRARSLFSSADMTNRWVDYYRRHLALECSTAEFR